MIDIIERMETSTLLGIITVVLTVIGLLGTLIGFIIKLANNNGKLAEKIAQIEQDQQGCKTKFLDFYNFKQSTGEKIVEQSSEIRHINATLQSIEQKLDKLLEDKNNVSH